MGTMKKEKPVYLSKYKKYCVAKKGKVLLTNLADYAMSFIAGFLVFACIGYPIFVASSSSVQAEVGEVGKELDQFVLSTHLNALDPKDEESTLSGEAMGKDYVVTLIKTSYFLQGEEMPYRDGEAVLKAPVDEKETFLYIGEEAKPHYPNDRIGYYYYVFKPGAEGVNDYVYDGVDYAQDKETPLYTLAYAYKNADLFEKRTDALPVYQQLSFDNAQKINDYLVYSTDDDLPKNLYNELVGHFSSARAFFVNEVETRHPGYISLYQRFSDSYSVIALWTNLVAVFSFLIGFAIMEFVAPLFVKDHRTVSARMMKMGYTMKDESEVTPWAAAVKGIVRAPLYFGSMFFGLYFMGLSSLTGFLWNGFSFFSLYLASLGLGLLSILWTLLNKNNQSLPEFAAGILCKDTNFMEAGDALEEKVHD